MNNKLTWVLLASLLINAALVGFVLGDRGRGGPLAAFNRRMNPPPGMMMNQPADAATRDILKSAFAAERDAIAKAMKDAAQARRESVAILHDDPLDMAKLDAAMARLRASSSAAQESFHRTLRDAAAKLNGPQRVVLARMLERAPMGRMGNQRGGGPISNAVVDIINDPERGPPGPPHDMPLPDGMGLGAPERPE